MSYIYVFHLHGRWVVLIENDPINFAVI